MKSYCPCCGADKGHTLSNCKNIRAMRKIIKDQDDKIRNAIARDKNIEALEKEIQKSQANQTFSLRIVDALLQLVELKRK